ncbi:MAG: peptidase [Lachnospiraceae bacterium]|nr:peptidase [Lachnospiraceae bacterium]
MVKQLRRSLRRFAISRSMLLLIGFLVLSSVLIRRLYDLQIVNGADYRENFSLKTTRTRTIKGTRGNIYDRNGVLLAGNKLSYSLTIEDSGTYDSKRERALSLNGEAYRISKILEKHGDSLDNDFHIIVGEDGNYQFDVSGTSLLRFKADIYGYAYIDNLKPAEENATVEEMMAYLTGNDKFAILVGIGKNPVTHEAEYTKDELLSAGLPEELTKEEILDIIYVRYQLFTTSYRRYVPVTIATDLSDASVADLMEQYPSLTGIEIVDDTVRVYYYPECTASLIGYTGKVSSEELTTLQAEDPSYKSTSIVGKSGLEKIYETSLKGTDGEETVYVDYVGKVLEVDESKSASPQAGSNLYLTIDAELQDAVYHILEQRIAGILETVIINEKSFDTSGVTDTADIRIPVYDVYNAVIENNILNLSNLSNPNASESEKQLFDALTLKQNEIFAAIENELTSETPTVYSELTSEMKEYESYIVTDLLMNTTKILDSSAVDKTDETYLAWARDESISMRDYLTYAASRNWIDVSAFAEDDSYLDSAEIYARLSVYIADYLRDDRTFSKKLLRHLMMEDRITGYQIYSALYYQDVFDRDDSYFDDFMTGKISSYDLTLAMIHNLVLTPSMLALNPCSGSVVITNPQNGDILACVSYPGYDNNRLANKMDTSYYGTLVLDESRPFYNKATQQTTAPGSTFKLVTTAAGLEEGVITLETEFECTGLFDLTDTPLACWNRSGHGYLNVVSGIMNSCNVFFSNVAYELGQTEDGTWSDSMSLTKIRQYASMFGLDKPSGIEIPEAAPSVSDRYAIASSIGQGTHAYTTTQMARYVSTLANGGSIYDITLADKLTDDKGTILEDFAAEKTGDVALSETTWKAIHNGMRAVIMNKPEYQDLPLAISGKTGTAQESKSKPSHALFISYAPSDNPEVAMAVRIGNGYSSTNATLVGRDIYQYMFSFADKDELIDGKAKTEAISNAQVD